MSLVSILEEMTAEIPSGETVDRKAQAPRRWSIAAMWLAEPDDHGKRFQQRITLTNPDGVPVVQAQTEFEMSTRIHRTVGRIKQFPVGVSGEYSLRMEIRELGQEPWREVGLYPVLVQHRTVSRPQPSR